MTGHRLHACDAGEIRWLRALAARAGVGAGTGGPEGAAHETPAAGEAAGKVASRAATRIGDAGVPEPGSKTDGPATGTLKVGSAPEGLIPDAEVAQLERAANHMPGAAPAPNARAPEDIARIATVAEGLHGEIRVIANRLIAGWVAEVQAYGESRIA